MKGNKHAKTPTEYINGLPLEQKRALTIIRSVIKKNLAKGFKETMNWGMICYEVPLSTYPSTYNKQPLVYAGLASQKNHMAVYLSGIYSDAQAYKKFIAEYKKTGKKLDVGKSCVRFKKLEDLPLDLIGKEVASMSMKQFIHIYEKYNHRKK